MHLKTYDFATGDVVSDRAEELDFGAIVQGDHCQIPAVLRIYPDTEVSISDLKVYLSNNGGWSTSEFGYYTSPSFVTNVWPGSEKLNNHFVEMRDATQGSPNGVSLNVTDSTSDFLWLDADIGSNQLGSTSVSYRFIFNYT